MIGKFLNFNIPTTIFCTFKKKLCCTKMFERLKLRWLCFDFSLCIIENDHNFDRTEDRATVFLK